MARQETYPLTPAEWKVMKIAWELKSCAARDVYQEAGRLYGMSASTVKTHLRRLVEKEFLARTLPFMFGPGEDLQTGQHCSTIWYHLSNAGSSNCPWRIPTKVRRS